MNDCICICFRLVKISMGGEVPRSYYLTENTRPQPRENMKTDLINAGNRKRLEIVIDRINTLLR